MKDGTCPKCGNGVVIQGARVLDDGPAGTNDLAVAVYVRPERMEGEVRGRLWANVCAVCGYVELYATNLNELAKAAVAGQTPEE